MLFGLYTLLVLQGVTEAVVGRAPFPLMLIYPVPPKNSRSYYILHHHTFIVKKQGIIILYELQGNIFLDSQYSSLTVYSDRYNLYKEKFFGTHNDF
jgi:hypothetical protein